MVKSKSKFRKIYFKLKACFIILFTKRTYAFTSCRKSKVKGNIWVDVYNSGGFIQKEVDDFEDLMHKVYTRIHHTKKSNEVLNKFKEILECPNQKKMKSQIVN